jgi:DNA mismatch endonuclease (patch repair protein)
MMSGIRDRNTRPEMLVRHALHARGYRYRLHNRKLPGTPDLVLSKFRAVIFVNGCFWHGHDCHLFRVPDTRKDFWLNKIEGNRLRDRGAMDALSASGWRVCVIWECAIRGKNRQHLLDSLMDRLENWMASDSIRIELRA